MAAATEVKVLIRDIAKERSQTRGDRALAVTSKEGSALPEWIDSYAVEGRHVQEERMSRVVAEALKMLKSRC